ncbi:HAD-IA family hydrolase [Sphingobacterium sp. SYP-B4668]|uniref:HAD-IA family hydrolase n=1 Tax=Sphingobacterium sp. SYP-B4668 TaxID=2996035 RepID=UPI0022DD8047|nr:HAD-IA family hydrolase [Sphingobacterium sp. SYP-B4668]
MKHYRNLLFDLDGTLSDPAEGITKSIAYSLAHFGIQVDDLHSLEPLIGPPIKQTLLEKYHFTEDQADIGVLKYRERFAEKGLYENILYDGIKDLLATAKKNGYRLYLATSKPTVFAEQILDYFSIRGYFDFVGGSALDDSRPTKTHVIQHVLAENNIHDTTHTLMIGDRKYDVIGGQNTGMDTMGVLYGFGNRQELEVAGATYTIESVAALNQFLTANRHSA